MPFEIKSQKEYESALKRINELWGAKANTRESSEYDALFEAVEKYETKHFPMDEPESYAAVEFHLDRLNLSIDALALAKDEKAILDACITKHLLVPEWLLVKISTLLNIPRDILGHSSPSQETIYSHNRAS